MEYDIVEIEKWSTIFANYKPTIQPRKIYTLNEFCLSFAIIAHDFTTLQEKYHRMVNMVKEEEPKYICYELMEWRMLFKHIVSSEAGF